MRGLIPFPFPWDPSCVYRGTDPHRPGLSVCLAPSTSPEHWFLSVLRPPSRLNGYEEPIGRDGIAESMNTLSLEDWEAYCWEFLPGQASEVCPWTFVDDEPSPLTECVYFIQGVEGGPIKIGTTTDLTARLAALQTGAPVPLRVLAAFPGSLSAERELHRRFIEWRSHGEWFHPNPDLLQLIAEAGRLPRK